MLGRAIAAQPIGESGLRELVTEFGGPRPAGVRPEGRARLAADDRTQRATRP